MRIELLAMLNDAQGDLRAPKETTKAEELMEVPDVEMRKDI